jgi:preprotein translocase subunit SecA
MDYLREGIHLRGFAQIDPLVAYKNEAYELFSDLMNALWADFARMIFHVEVEVEGQNGGVPEPPAAGFSPQGSATSGGSVSYSGGVGTRQPSALTAASEGGGGVAMADPDDAAPGPVQQRQLDAHEQLGRNEPCWCGSGRKYKKCHGAAA